MKETISNLIAFGLQNKYLVHVTGAILLVFFIAGFVVAGTLIHALNGGSDG